MKKTLLNLLIFISVPILAQVGDNQGDKALFLQRKLGLVTRKHALNEEQIKNLTEAFYEADKTVPNDRYNKLFRQAAAKVVEDPDEYYNLFKKEIDAIVTPLYFDMLWEYQVKYQLNKEQLDPIKPDVAEKERQNVLVDLMFADNHKIKSVRKKRINEKYDKLIEEKLTLLGIRTDLVNKYCSFFHFNRNINLTEEQQSRIFSFAWRLKELAKTRPLLNIGIEEHKNIKNILTEQQYNEYLTNKVVHKSRKEAFNKWNDAKRFGIDAEMDSVTTIQEVMRYYVQYFKIGERYSIIPHSEAEKGNELNFLRRMSEPRSLKKIREAILTENKIKKNDIESLVW